MAREFNFTIADAERLIIKCSLGKDDFPTWKTFPGRAEYYFSNFTIFLFSGLCVFVSDAGTQEFDDLIELEAELGTVW